MSSLRALRRPAFYAALCTILFIAGNSLPATASSAVSGVRPIELPGLMHIDGVLRQAGGVYQFRHARLRDHLANQ